MRVLLLVCLVLSLPARLVEASGLSLAGHGVRAMGRGGALVAGGDDAGGIWQNPAVIAGLPGFQVALDGTLVFFRAQYTRVDSGGNILPTVSFEGPILPIPTFAISRQVGLKRLFLGLGLTAPYSPTIVYPGPSYAPCDAAAPVHCIDTAHRDAPQRYSIISQDGTKMILLDLVAAYQILPQLSVGLSLQNYFINFTSISSITSYNGALASGPEDPDFDSLVQSKMLSMFNPSAKFGFLYRPHPMVTIGASYQLPFWVSGASKINVQLPVSPLYEKASVQGDSARMRMTLPMCLRTGVEVRPIPSLRVELGVDWEQWSAFDAIYVDPQDIYILNIPSIDRFRVPTLATPLNLGDTITVRLGAEYLFSRLPLVIRAGYIFEQGAASGAAMSVSGLDGNKHLVTVGAGYSVGGYRFDFYFAHAIQSTNVVDWKESLAKQINPINPGGAATIGGGSYTMSYSLVGLGVAKSFPW
jgi:long-chain fatty acid transport protein